MFSQYFGNYLLNNGLITPEKLKDALTYLKSVHVKLGILAIDAKYMTVEQVEKIHKMQTGVDKRFGELAVDEGYLTVEQLDELLSRQNKGHLLLSQALVDKGYFTFEQVESTLCDYKRASGFSDAEFEALNNNDIEKVASMFLRMDGYSSYQIHLDCFVLFIKIVVRFIDDTIRFEMAERIDEHDFEWIAYQYIEGKYTFMTAISGDGAAMSEFAGRFAREKLTGMDEMARDSVGEFMNCSNGLFLSKLSNDGIDLELLPQSAGSKGKLMADGPIYRIPFYLPFGCFDFIIAEGRPFFR